MREPGERLPDLRAAHLEDLREPVLDELRSRRQPVLHDRGEHALGAKGVLIGRATLYGACAAGEAGAYRAIEILREELVRTMQLCGVPRVSDITPDLVTRDVRVS